MNAHICWHFGGVSAVWKSGEEGAARQLAEITPRLRRSCKAVGSQACAKANGPSAHLSCDLRPYPSAPVRPSGVRSSK
jgi:hypothetical protein